jgi:hypothetical protein
MDICVPVNCSDKTIEVSLNTLLKYEYFKKMLSNGITKMSYNKSKTINDEGNKMVTYTISVPYISVECSSKVLLLLLSNCEYKIYPNNYTDELIEIMLYNDMYRTNLRLTNATWGLNESVYFGMIYFIKQKLPTVDVYGFLRNSGFWAPGVFITYSFELCAQNKLDSIVVEDLLGYLEEYLLINKLSCFDYDKIILCILNTIINCCVEYNHIIKTQVNDQIIRNMLNKFVLNYKYDCTESLYDRDTNIVSYNVTLEKIFEKLQTLSNLNLINLNNIGTIQEFQVY